MRTDRIFAGFFKGQKCFGGLRRFSPYLIFLVAPASSLCKAVPIQTDSVFYKDTTIALKIIRQSQPLKLGVGASYGWNIFRDLTLPSPLDTLCQVFQSGKGNGVNFLVGADLALTDKFFFSPQIVYENFSGDHTWNEFETVRSGSEIRQAQFDHIISATTKAVGAKFTLGWEFLHPIYFAAGPALYYLFD